MTFDVVQADPSPVGKRPRGRTVTGLGVSRTREGELMKVHRSEDALQRSDKAAEVAMRSLYEPAASGPLGTTSISCRKGAFSMVAAYPAEVAAVSRARRHLHQLMVLMGLSAVADSVALGAHELMANAVTHGCRHQNVKSFTVKVAGSGERVRVEVQDPSDRRPSQRPPSDEREGGRGLLLVDALALIWGVQVGPGPGKTVWMELDVPREGATP